ncbi:methylmalonyl Co-A mutase-associated GTPase MeaB [Haliea sp.]
MSETKDNVAAFIDRLLAGEVSALARAISLVEARNEIGGRIHRAIQTHSGRAQIVGITGPPGVGKSTLINAYITSLRRQNKRVAVVAVDPSSPLTGGSVLGDRTRMGRHSDDPEVFIRSVSARGHLGGLSATIHSVVDLIDCAGWDIIVLETVGTGQSETEVMEIADVNIVIIAPGLGDDVQAIKAGILEIADILVINKSDTPMAIRTERQLKAMLQLRHTDAQSVPVLQTTATEEKGIDDLAHAIEEKFFSSDDNDRKTRLLQRVRRQVAQEASEKIKHLVLSDASDTMNDLLLAIIEGKDNHENLLDIIITTYFSDSGLIGRPT